MAKVARIIGGGLAGSEAAYPLARRAVAEVRAAASPCAPRTRDAASAP